MLESKNLEENSTDSSENIESDSSECHHDIDLHLPESNLMSDRSKNHNNFLHLVSLITFLFWALSSSSNQPLFFVDPPICQNFTFSVQYPTPDPIRVSGHDLLAESVHAPGRKNGIFWAISVLIR